MIIAEKSVNIFTSELGSKAAVPGGGGAAALAGAMGAALCSMAGNLTIGKKKYADVEAELKLIIEKSENIRQRLCVLIDEDARAFEPLARAYSMPKNAPNYSAIMRKVTINACEAPLEIMECCCKAIDIMDELVDKCSKLVISDVGCGVITAKAALKAAALNVFVNTKTLDNDAETLEIETKVNGMLAAYESKAEAIYSSVLNELRR